MRIMGQGSREVGEVGVGLYYRMHNSTPGFIIYLIKQSHQGVQETILLCDSIIYVRFNLNVQRYEAKHTI